MSLKEDIEKVKKKVDNIEETSLAWEIVKDGERRNKRQFIIILVILCMWFSTIGYLVYILNDIEVIETATQETTQEVSQENENGSNNFIGHDGDITNGKTND